MIRGIACCSSQGATAMAIVCYALIPRENYNVLRHISPDLPETYERWVADQERKKTAASAQRQEADRSRLTTF
jgi:hypothetical protein